MDVWQLDVILAGITKVEKRFNYEIAADATLYPDKLAPKFSIIGAINACAAWSVENYLTDLIRTLPDWGGYSLQTFNMNKAITNKEIGLLLTYARERRTWELEVRRTKSDMMARAATMGRTVNNVREQKKHS